MKLSSKQKFAVFIGITVVITGTAVLMAQKGKLGESAQKLVNKYDSKVSSTSQIEESAKTPSSDQVGTTEKPNSNPLFSSSRIENENLDPLDNLTTFNVADIPEFVDDSLGDPL